MDIPDFCDKYGSYWSAIYLKKALDDNNIRYDIIDTPSAEDIMFMLKTFCLFNSLYIIDRSYYNHRMDNENSSIHMIDTPVWNTIKLYDKLNEFLLSKGNKISKELWEIKNRREVINLYLSYIVGRIKNNRLKYLFVLSTRFRKMIKDSSVDLPPIYEKPFYKIAKHPILFNIGNIYNCKYKNILQSIFSVKNSFDKSHKVITILGINFKFRSKIHQIYFKLQQMSSNFPYWSFTVKITSYWKTYHTNAVIEEFEKVENSLDFWVHLNSYSWLIYMSCLIENKKYDKAIHILRRFVQKFNYTNMEKFLPVADFAYKNGYMDETLAKASFIFENLEKNINNHILDNYIKNKKIAIVGNAGTELNKNRGEEIDNYDVVVRFNNFPEGYANDYGNKTNIWVHGIGAWENDIKDDRDLSQFNIILWYQDIWHEPLRFNHFNILYRDIYQYKNKIIYIPQYYHKSIMENYDLLFPSSGSLVLYTLLEMKNYCDIKAYGFSFLDENGTHNGHYFDNTCRIGIDHDFDFEKSVMKNLYLKQKKQKMI